MPNYALLLREYIALVISQEGTDFSSQIGYTDLTEEEKADLRRICNEVYKEIGHG